MLQFFSTVQIFVNDELVELEEEIRHYSIGSANSGLSTNNSTTDKLFIWTIKDNMIFPTFCDKDLNILSRHRRVFNPNNSWIFTHFRIEGWCQGRSRQLRNIVDDKVSIRSRCTHIVPVLSDRIVRQTEVNRRNSSDGINTQTFSMLSQFYTVLSVVAGYMSDNCQFALGHFHDIFQN